MIRNEQVEKKLQITGKVFSLDKETNQSKATDEKF